MKKFISLVLIVSLLVGVVACSPKSNDQNNKNDSKAESSESVEGNVQDKKSKEENSESKVDNNNTKETSSEEDSQDEDKKSLKFGCMALTEPMLTWLKEGLEPKGYEVEIVTFDGNHLPAVALTENSIDGMILNYLPWLETFNQETNSDLHMTEPHLYFGFSALFSSKYKSLDEIPEKAKVAVAGDPSNLEFSLLILQEAGLIKLGEKTGNFYSLVDVEENPKNIEILETEVTQTARYIDEVDFVVLDSGTAAEAGIDTKSFIFPEKELIEQMMDAAGSKIEVPLFIDPDFGLIIRGEDKDLQWVKDATEVYLSDEFREKFNKEYKGAYILYNK